MHLAGADGLLLLCCLAARLQLTEAPEDADGALGLQRGTHRSNVPGSNLVTARLVDVDVAEGEGTPGRAPAHLAGSPTGSQEVRCTCTERTVYMRLCHFTSVQQLQPGLLLQRIS